jgi:hypothetical protein
MSSLATDEQENGAQHGAARQRLQAAVLPSRSRVFSIKVPVTLIAAVDRTLRRFLHTRREAPISRNEFIRRAIEERLDHLRRSSRPHRRRGRRPRKGALSGGGNTALGGNGFPVATVRGTLPGSTEVTP